MIRVHWRHLFHGERDQEAAERVAMRTFELSQYLVDELGWRPPAPAVRAEVAYHDSCHMLRELRLRDQPRTLLAAVANVKELPRADRCCGFGGTFSVRYPDVSTAMADDKLASAAAVSAGVVASADPGCVMQIEGRASRVRAGVRVVHLATVVAEAL
jgi:L-lactate dehydrogenase complex protein LldE